MRDMLHSGGKVAKEVPSFLIAGDVLYMLTALQKQGYGLTHTSPELLVICNTALAALPRGLLIRLWKAALTECNFHQSTYPLPELIQKAQTYSKVTTTYLAGKGITPVANELANFIQSHTRASKVALAADVNANLADTLVVDTLIAKETSSRLSEIIPEKEAKENASRWLLHEAPPSKAATYPVWKATADTLSSLATANEEATKDAVDFLTTIEADKTKSDSWKSGQSRARILKLASLAKAHLRELNQVRITAGNLVDLYKNFDSLSAEEQAQLSDF